MSVKSNIDDLIFDFQKFEKHVQTEIIDSGLDKVLQASTKDLKDKLLTTLSEIREKPTAVPTTKTEDIIDIPKSEEEILQHLTGINVQKFNQSKDYTSFTESNVVFADRNKGQGQPKRVRLRIPMSAGDTFEQQLDRATRFFNETMFAIPDETGVVSYFVNPGIDISRYVKVVCSTKAGDDAEGKSRDRFDRMTQKYDYAEWSIFQNTIDEVIKKNFINITPTVNNLKKGDVEEAIRSLSQVKNNLRIEEIKQKVVDLEKKQQLNPGMEAYVNLTDLIKSLSIHKTKAKQKVIYSLKANVKTTAGLPKEQQTLEEDFLNRLKIQISNWKLQNSEQWFQALVKITEQKLKEFKNK